MPSASADTPRTPHRVGSMVLGASPLWPNTPTALDTPAVPVSVSAPPGTPAVAAKLARWGIHVAEHTAALPDPDHAVVERRMERSPRGDANIVRSIAAGRPECAVDRRHLTLQCVG